MYKNNAVLLDQLAISGIIPKAFVTWLEAIRKFYTTIKNTPEIQEKLQRLRLRPNDVDTALGKITQLEAARSKYLIEKGESQEATQTKDAAIAQIDDWMSEFYAVARIALEDKPQLLEALGKVVK